MATLILHRLLTLCFLPASFVFFSASPSPSVAWGVHGHYATCLIAQKLFSQATQNAVTDLLPDNANGDLASLCSWPDEMRFKYRWSAALHYIDTPDFRCNYDYGRDCFDSSGVEGRCAAGAINNYTSQLASYNSNSQQYNLTEALLFLAHIVGDIHQPLHVGFTSDLGGNTIKVHWYRRIMNLHHIWDNEIINTANQRYYEASTVNMVEEISRNITEGRWTSDISKWGICANDSLACPDIYAVESVKAACNWAYRNATPGSYLSDDYFLTRFPVVEMRLAQGGVRLAAILNRIFGEGQLHSSI